MSKRFFVRWPVLLLIAVAVADASMFAYLRFVFSPGWQSDAVSHMLNARMMLYAITPGFSQLGFWPPILHLLLLPAVYFDVIYTSDTAGFIVLFPVLYGATYCLFRTVEMLTESRAYAWLSVALFLLNPYVLYYSTAPMTEIVYIAAYLSFVFCWLRWMKGASDAWALFSAGFISIGFLSRYEGIVMVPLVIPLFFFSSLLRGAKVKQAASLTILCLCLAMIGIAWVLLYGSYYGGDPFSFLAVGRRTGVEESANVTTSIIFNQIKRSSTNIDRVVTSWRLSTTAAQHMIGSKVWIVGVFLSIYALLFSRNTTRTLGLLLASMPFFAILGLLILKRANLAVPEVFVESNYRGSAYSNVRYLLPAIVLPVIGSAVALNQFGKGLLSRIMRVCAITLLLSITCWNLFDVVYVNKFRVIRRDISNVSTTWQLDSFGAIFDKYYDYGFVLMVRHFSEAGIARSKIPLNAFITEGSYLYIKQATKEPWLFARMVVVGTQSRIIQANSLRKRAESEVFQTYYNEVYRDNAKTIYKLDDGAVQRAATSLGLSRKDIPSLNLNMRKWNPKQFYTDISASKQ